LDVVVLILLLASTVLLYLLTIVVKSIALNDFVRFQRQRRVTCSHIHMCSNISASERVHRDGELV
jgi:hypothetical protein